MSVFKMSGSEIKTLLDEAEKSRLDATGGVDLSKPQLKPGAYLLALRDVKAVNKKYGNNDTMTVVCNVNVSDMSNENFRDILYTFTMLNTEKPDNEKIGRSMLVGFLDRAFGYQLQPCNSEADLVNQIARFKGKPFQAAVREREFLSKGKAGGPAWVLNTVSEIWYTGSENEENFTVDPTKLKKELNAADKEKFATAMSMSVSAPSTTAFAEEPVAAPAAPVVQSEEDTDDLPF